MSSALSRAASRAALSRAAATRAAAAALTGLALLVASLGTAHAAGGSAEAGARGNLVAAWSPSMTGAGPSFHRQTIRMVAHSSVAGAAARITLSNRYSSAPLAVAEATVAVQASGGRAVPGTVRAVTFGHAARVTVPAGGEVAGDAVPLAVRAGENLLVSLYLPGATGPSTWHPDAFDTSFTASGDHAADTAASAFRASTSSWYYLSGLDVVPATARGAVVAFGDSITDGYHSSTGTYHRWPDLLADRLQAGPGPQRLSVVDAGIGGNRVLTDAPNPRQGVSALKRFAHDALAQPGVKDVILLEGINDIGNNAGPNGTPLTAAELIDGYRTLIGAAHAAHVRIIGATLLPIQGNRYYSPTAETLRQTVNQWIRTSGAFDGVVDFDRVLRDQNNIAALNPAYDSGDHLHPDDAGMQAMADAVDLRLLHG